MSLAALYSSDRCPISFELFPPKTEAGFNALYRNVEQLNKFNPDYFTCTYGAGGSTQGATLDVLEEVRKRSGKPVASHLTCVGATVDDLRSYLKEAMQRGTDYIVALRGDPPQGETAFQSVEGGLSYANELVDLISSEYPDLGIAVAGYPEVHQEAPSAELDLENLKRKVDAGADIVITQLFYDNADFFSFRDKCHAAGISVPIVPGLLPITNFAQAKRIASLCKANLPDAMVARFQENDSEEWQFRVGVEHARKQAVELLSNGVDGFHLYVLNKSQAATELLTDLEFPGH